LKKKIKIISPSTSFEIASNYNFDRIKDYFEKLGFLIELSNDWLSQKKDIGLKVEVIHDAFRDKNVAIIICAFGGFTSINLVDKLDYELIKQNPKPLFGFSDITILLNAIYTKTNISTFYGPLLMSFMSEFKREYVLDYFNKSLYNCEEYELLNSNEIIDYNDTEEKTLRKSNHYIIQKGTAEGIVVGGHIPTFNLLQGTEYFPDLNNKILLLEMNELENTNSLVVFERLLASLKLQPHFNQLKGILIGSFHSSCKVTMQELQSTFDHLSLGMNIPIIANCNFGHILPITTIPIGGEIKIETEPEIKITVRKKHPFKGDSVLSKS
jgi:muramoyltetrapeptide carboxypeptidase